METKIFTNRGGFWGHIVLNPLFQSGKGAKVSAPHTNLAKMNWTLAKRGETPTSSTTNPKSLKTRPEFVGDPRTNQHRIEGFPAHKRHSVLIACCVPFSPPVMRQA